MPTPIRDPNLPGDPSELREIPDRQHPDPSWDTSRPMNPVIPGAPPSPDYPTGVPPGGGPEVPDVPPSGSNPPVLDSINPISSDQSSQSIDCWGSGFTATSLVMFDGAQVSTTLVRDTWVKGQVNSPGNGTYDVWVTDTGGDSAHYPFTFSGGKSGQAPASKKK